MTRQVLIVVGVVPLSFGGIGIIVGVVWLTASKVLGTLPYIFDARGETLLYLLPRLAPLHLRNGRSIHELGTLRTN